MQNNDTTGVVPFARCQIGIVIKALNERTHIARAIASAQVGAPGFTSCVVLADSGSTDGTVEIAQGTGIRIVQLANLSEKSCGIGAQLGFQHLDCDYVYILDGDMELRPDFIPAAVALLEEDRQLAGVAGLVEEFGEGNYEFERRKATNDGLVVGEVEALDMGGLYRADLVRQVGYLTNRNLHSYEEKELAMRLRAAGHRLRRIDRPAVRHYGKTQSTGALLAMRWKSRHLDGPGELLRSSFGKPYFKRSFKLFWRPIAVALSWLWLLVALPFAGVAPAWLLPPLLFQLALFLNFLRRARGLSGAGIAYVNLQIISASLVRGLLRRQVPPGAPIQSAILA